MLSLQSFLREGRVVGPCWDKLKPEGPKGFTFEFEVSGFTSFGLGFRVYGLGFRVQGLEFRVQDSNFRF